MDPLTTFLTAVGARITVRASNDIGDRVYDTVVGAGRLLLRKLFESARSGDEAATEVAVAEYAAHLEANPVEGDRVLAAAMETVKTEPLAVLESIVEVICQTLMQVDTIPHGSKAAGCAAFAGSFPNADYVTVVDAGDGSGGMAELPKQDEFAGEDALWLGYDTMRLPRMWIVEPEDPAGRDELVTDLNAKLLDKANNPTSVAQVELAQVRGAARVWRVMAIFGDRVAIHYPDPERQAALAKAGDNLADRVLAGLQETEAVKLSKREQPLFDIRDPTGTSALFASVRALYRSDKELREAREAGWSQLADEVGGTPG